MNGRIEEWADRLDIHNSFEFSRTHWSVKDADLGLALLSEFQTIRPKPRVFEIGAEVVNANQVSVMMPFAGFDSVYAAIRDAAALCKLQCNRADDIWEHDTIIQDIATLIDRSQIVVCDCTNKNPNVFYEMGIAHTLGRNVVLITQSQNDVPFDIAHHRYIRYLNNEQGLDILTQNLAARFADLVPLRV